MKCDVLMLCFDCFPPFFLCSIFWHFFERRLPANNGWYILMSFFEVLSLALLQCGFEMRSVDFVKSNNLDRLVFFFSRLQKAQSNFFGPNAPSNFALQIISTSFCI